MKKTILFFLLGLFFNLAKSQDLTKDSVITDSCIVFGIVNIDLKTVELQNKYEQDFTLPSVIVGKSMNENDVSLYWLDSRYDLDLYTIQKGDTILLEYPSFRTGKKQVVSIDNFSFKNRCKNYENKLIDIDFWEVERRASAPPTLDDGLFVQWQVAKQRFMKHIVTDKQGLHKLDIDNEKTLCLSERLFSQLYSFYVLAHNETIRNKK